MEIGAAQRDLACAYVAGAPGVLMSGLAWLVAGLVWMRFGVAPTFAALFAGGMLIVPVSLALVRLVFRAPKMARGNPLERLGLESTFVLFAGLFTGYALLRVAPELAMPAVAITIGARYFTFRTLYGEPLYWALGAAVAGVGAFATVEPTLLPVNPALAVGVVELTFAALLLARRKRVDG